MDNNSEDLKHIRLMMERSTKFLLLSGMSGISAGVVALIGALLTYLRLENIFSVGSSVFDIMVLAVCTLISAALLGIYFSLRKAKKDAASKFWMPATKQILREFLIPLIIGGIFCIILLVNDSVFFVAPTMLIFYGLSLINAGTRTYSDIRSLGYCEVVLGIIAGFVPHYGLYIWALGFGVLHIVYGVIMYFRYDNKTNRN